MICVELYRPEEFSAHTGNSRIQDWANISKADMVLATTPTSRNQHLMNPYLSEKQSKKNIGQALKDKVTGRNKRTQSMKRKYSGT